MARGDHLVVQYPGFTHHGIDLGDGTVIEYGGKDAGSPTIRRVWRADFIARGQCTVRPYPAGTTLSPTETVSRAWARLQEQRYDLFNNNCEHFAYWCKTGHHLSPQVNAWKQIAALGIVAGLVATLANTSG